MRFDLRYREERHVDSTAHAAIGRTTLGHVNAGPQPARSPDGRVWAVMEGEIYAAGSAPPKDSDLECLITHATRGAEGLRALNGSFVAALWDQERRELTLINDRFGMRPLYYAVVGGRLLFSSNLAALLADPALVPVPDKTGLAQFLTFGQYLGSDTSVAGIKVLPASSIATFRADGSGLTIDRYWRHDAMGPQYSSDAEWLERIDESFATAVARQTAKPGNLGIAISGGLDARTIFALIDQLETPTSAICYSIRGSLDHRCSEQMSRIAGSVYHHYELGTAFLTEYRSHLERMVLLTDGQYLSQCIVMPTLPIYRQHGIDVLLRGHAGELMHMHKAYAYSMDNKGLGARTAADAETWLLSHLQAYMLDSVDVPLLMPEYQEALETEAASSLRRVISEGASVDPPIQAAWELFVTQRLRRETSLSMAKFMSTVDVRLPYLDNDLMQLLLTAPPRLKMGDTIQEFILRKRRPRFLEVTNANTGTRIGAPMVVQRVSGFKKRVLAKLRVPGYQPYERLGLWLRQELAPMVEDVLLSEQCRDRGIFQPDGLSSVVASHLAGKANATYLIMALLIIELGQRHLHNEGGFSAKPS